MQQCRLVKLAFNANRKLLERQARLSNHNVKRSEWFDSFGKVISRSMSLGHPFADDALSVSKHGQKSLSVFVDPLIEQPVLLVSRRSGRPSRAAKGVKDSIQHRNGYARAVQFLLNDHGVVPVSRPRRANPSLPCRDRPIRRAKSAVRQVANRPVRLPAERLEVRHRGGGSGIGCQCVTRGTIPGESKPSLNCLATALAMPTS
jgi:hypothetical protein